MTLLTKEDEYTNNKQKIKMLCKCGEPYEAVLSDIKRGKNCKSCKTEKFKETCLEIYGEDNVSKVPFIFEKILISNFRRKVFEFPETKRKVIVMGYEPMAITTLISRETDPYLLKKIHEDDIILGKEIKRFRYKDNEGTDHVYFPDIYINNTNHIIEVKSDYTFYRDREINILKFRAVVENGYILRLMIYNDKKELKYESMCITTENIEKMCQEIDTVKF